MIQDASGDGLKPKNNSLEGSSIVINGMQYIELNEKLEVFTIDECGDAIDQTERKISEDSSTSKVYMETGGLFDGSKVSSNVDIAMVGLKKIDGIDRILSKKEEGFAESNKQTEYNDKNEKCSHNCILVSESVEDSSISDSTKAESLSNYSEQSFDSYNNRTKDF